MAKKKQPPPVATEPTPLGLDATMTRDDQGYGAIAGIDYDESQMEISEAQLAAVLDALQAKGLEARVVTLREQCPPVNWPFPGKTDPLTELKERDECTAWEPNAPEGDGWRLVAVLHNGLVFDDGGDVRAIFVRTGEAGEVGAVPATQPNASQSNAALFLIGNLMQAAKRRFTELALPWRELKEDEQERVLRNLADDVRVAAGKAIRAIASNRRLSFRAEVESVQFKGPSDIKAVLKLAGGEHSHALADSAGGFVTVVIEDVTELLDIPEIATRGDADQKPLFDVSTAGTALDTEREEVPA
jgi:hypothetical protein